MKKYLVLLFLIVPTVVSAAWWNPFTWFKSEVILAGPSEIYQKTILPQTDSTYTLGASGKEWLSIYTDELCLNASCRSSWPSGGGGGSGSIGTSTALANTQVTYATGVDTIGSEAAFTYNSTANRLTFDYGSTTALTVSGTSYLGTVGSGTWNGTAIDISSYTNLTAGDALTLTGDDIDFDGGATPAGDLGGTWASPSVTDDSHAHTGSTISGVDISSDTNLAVSGAATLTGDTIGVDTTGTWSGNAGTATALAANGANCSAGSYPLGVNASGAVEDCTVASSGGGSGTVSTSTNETAGQLPYWTTTSGTPAKLGSIATTTLTCSGNIGCTAGVVIGSSPVSIGLSNPVNSSFTLAGGGSFIDSSSSSGTAGYVLMSRGTGASWVATTTFSGGLEYSAGNVTANCVAITGSASLCDGSDSSGGGGGDFAWTPTTYSGVAVNATTTPIWFKATTPYSTIASSTYTSATTTTGALQAGSTAITTGNNVLKVSPLTGLTSAGSESAGGLMNITTLTTDAIGLAMYNNHTGTSRLLSLVCDAPTYSGNCLHVRSDGTATALNVSGAPTGQGLVKLGAGGVGDADASMLSIDASTNSFAGQGFFLKCGAASATCWNIRDSANTQQITALATGFLGLGTTSPYARLSVVGQTVSSYFTATTTTASTFPYASTTAISNTSSLGTNMIAPFVNIVANFASSTAIVGTTTIYLGPSMGALTVDGARCETDTGTVGVSLYDGTNRADYIPTASTTINFVAFSTNNTFTKGESMRVDIGTPASSPKQVTCKFQTRYTSF